MANRLILVTNDDGYFSKGIEAAIEVAQKFGRVVVVAPDTVQSGKSQAITMFSPLFSREIKKTHNLEIHSFSGTPVDCVKFAFDHMLKDQKVDLVISGINHGSNSAVSVLYSGTMGAAIEGSFYGCPSVGLSLTDYNDDADFEAAKIYSERIISTIFESDIEMPLCLNINIPKGDVAELKGIKVCRQNKGYWKESFYSRRDPHDNEYFWLSGKFINHEIDAIDTDEWALNNNYVSVVPVQVDLTEYKQIATLDKLLK